MGARKCHCWDCVGIREGLRDQRGYHIEDEYETPYRKSGKGKKKCKRSKDGQHDWTAFEMRMVWTFWTELVYENYKIVDRVPKRGYREKKVIICAKCSKPQSYAWRWGY